MVNTISNIRVAAGNDMITVQSLVSTLHGETVVETSMLIVARGAEVVE